MQWRSRSYNGNADQNVGHRGREMFIETLRGVRTAAGWRGLARPTLFLPTLGGRRWAGLCSGRGRDEAVERAERLAHHLAHDERVGV